MCIYDMLHIPIRNHASARKVRPQGQAVVHADRDVCYSMLHTLDLDREYIWPSARSGTVPIGI